MRERLRPAGGSRWLALLSLFALHCASPYPAPTAVIGALGEEPKQTQKSATTPCAPIASPLAAHIGAAVPVTGVCSTDPDSRPLSYVWSLVNAPAGSTSGLHNADAVTPSFVPDVHGAYRLRLVVSNGVVPSDPVFAEISVGECGGRVPQPTPSASSVTPKTGELVMLAAAVTDGDTAPGCEAHAAKFEYAWSFTALPAGSAAALNDPNLAAPSFVPDVAGAYALDLRVTDPTGRSATGSLVLNASRVADKPEEQCGDASPVAVARRIAPDAPVDCSLGVLTSDLHGESQIQLDGSPSYDPDNGSCDLGQALDYRWTLLTTPFHGGLSRLFSVDGRTTVLYVASDGDYLVRLVVRDATGLPSREAFCALRIVNSR